MASQWYNTCTGLPPNTYVRSCIAILRLVHAVNPKII